VIERKRQKQENKRARDIEHEKGRREGGREGGREGERASE